MADTLLASLLAVQKEAPKLHRDADGQIQNRTYRYLTLETLMAEVLPLLNKHGLVWVTKPGRDNTNHPALTYELIHAATSERITGQIPLMVQQGTPQEQGSAITYARRYALMAVLGLAADDDDDGAAAAAAAKRTPKPKTEPAPKKDDAVSSEQLKVLIAGHVDEIMRRDMKAWGQVAAWAKEREIDLKNIPEDKLRAVEHALNRKLQSLDK